MYTYKCIQRQRKGIIIASQYKGRSLSRYTSGVPEAYRVLQPFSKDIASKDGPQSRLNCIVNNGKNWLLDPGTSYSRQSEGYSSKWLIWLLCREPLIHVRVPCLWLYCRLIPKSTQGRVLDKIFICAFKMHKSTCTIICEKFIVKNLFHAKSQKFLHKNIRICGACLI